MISLFPSLAISWTLYPWWRRGEKERGRAENSNFTDIDLTAVFSSCGRCPFRVCFAGALADILPWASPPQPVGPQNSADMSYLPGTSTLSPSVKAPVLNCRLPLVL